MRIASGTTDGLLNNTAATAQIPRSEPDRGRRGARMDEVLETIAAISHAAVEGIWHDVLLDRLAAIMPGVAVVLSGHDRHRRSGNFIMHRGLPRDLATRRAAAIAAGTGGDPAAWVQPVGVVFASEADRPAGRKLDGGARGGGSFGLVLRRNGTRQLVLELRAPISAAGHGLKVEPEEELLGILAPHLVTAARIAWLRADPSASAMPAAALLRALSIPLILLDADRRVQSLNDAARHATSRMETLHIGADGHLRAVDAESERRLSDAVDLAAAGVRGRCDLLELRNAAGTRRIFASLRRLDTNGGAVSPGETQAEALVALAFQDAGEPLDLGAAALWEAFGLSPAEAALALRLLEGRSLGEIAAAHRVAKQTLRNQLAAVMRKTGTSRQAELVALLTRLALVALR
jgi:DNA-binding CsgD family transcriptional regulator